MFHCGFCSKVSESGDRPTPVVIEWREKTYPSVKLPLKFGDPRPRMGRSGKGYEAVKILNACTPCVKAEKAVGAVPPKIERTAIVTETFTSHTSHRPTFSNRPSARR
jgi:hypothetical protein